MGVDAGSRHVGLSATTEKRVLYEADVELRADIVNLLADRHLLRSRRRSNKTRYRPARYFNKKFCDGWLPPSFRYKIECHLRVIEQVYAILPISDLIVEVASFDQQKINNPDITKTERKYGEQYGFGNVREYVLFRDDHTCQCCKGKSGDKILNVHHIESKKTGGNAPNNLVTLCRTCHMGIHSGAILLPTFIVRGASLKDASFMNVMRRTFCDKLIVLYPNVKFTYGYITKQVRIQNKLPKEHLIDARCISGNPLAVSDGVFYRIKKVRCHNRQLHRCTFLKGGYRKRNQAEYKVFGFRLYDKVKYDKQECFIWGRRVVGSFRLCKLDGTEVAAKKTHRKLKFLETRRSYLVERCTYSV